MTVIISRVVKLEALQRLSLGVITTLAVNYQPHAMYSVCN